MPEKIGDHSQLSRKQILTALVGVFVLCAILLISVWLVVDSGKRYQLPIRTPNSDRTNVSALDATPTPTCTITPVPLQCSFANCGINNPAITPSGTSARFFWDLTGDMAPAGSDYRIIYGRGSGSYRCYGQTQAVLGHGNADQSCREDTNSYPWNISCALFAPDGSYRAECSAYVFNTTPTLTPTPMQISCHSYCIVSGLTVAPNPSNPANSLIANWQVTTYPRPPSFPPPQYTINYGVHPRTTPGAGTPTPAWAWGLVGGVGSTSYTFNLLAPETTYDVNISCNDASISDHFCSEMVGNGTTASCTSCTTPTPTQTHTNTPTPTRTPTRTPSPTPTRTPTSQPGTPTNTPTRTPTLTPTNTGTPATQQFTATKEFTDFSTLSTITYANYRITITNTGLTAVTNITIDDTVPTSSQIISVLHTPEVTIVSQTATTFRANIQSLSVGQSAGIVMGVQIPTSGKECPGQNQMVITHATVHIPPQIVTPPNSNVCVSSTNTPTPTKTPTVTPTVTPHGTTTPTPTPTLTGTPTPTQTPTPTLLSTATPTYTTTPTQTPTSSVTPTGTLTPTAEPTITYTPTPTPLLGEIGNYVWEDVNDNGLQDAGEPAISAAYVQLLNCTDNTVAYATTNTNIYGNYLFTGLTSRCYRVKFYPVAGYTMCTKQHIDPTKPDLDSDAGVDWISQQINLGVGESNLTIDACLRKKSISTDLSLTKTASTTDPTVWSNVTFTLTVKNEGENDANNVEVKDYLPSGFLFVSATPVDDPSARYDSIENIWHIGTIPKGQSRQLLLVVKVVSISNLTNIAEIYSMLENDIDSTPNNLNTSEDDYGSVTLIATLATDQKGKLADTGVASILTFGIGSSLLIAAIAIEEMRGRVSYRTLDDDDEDD